jgi:hypothetical protein
MNHQGGSFSWALEQLKAGAVASRAAAGTARTCGWCSCPVARQVTFAEGSPYQKAGLVTGQHQSAHRHVHRPGHDATGLALPRMTDLLAMDWQIMPAEAPAA